MAKKKVTPVVKVKDPKKVAAGKARAAKSLRINGRFTTNQFLEEITEKAQLSGVKNVKKYFQQNEKELTALYTEWMEGVQIYDYKFLQTIRDYSGKLIVNGRENTMGTALKKVMSLNQFLRVQHNVVSWNITPMLKMDGQLKFDLPEDTDGLEDLDTEELEDLLNSYGINIIISEKKNYKTTVRYNSKKGKYIKKIKPDAKK